MEENNYTVISPQTASTVQLLLFYNEKTHPDTYFLSNFYPDKVADKIDVWYNGQSWPTSEHLYQALKFECYTEVDKQWREIIRTARTPFQAKYLGNQRTDTRYAWMQPLKELVQTYRPLVRLAADPNGPTRLQWMMTAVQAKFWASVPLAEKLMATGIMWLAEDSNDDWGWRGQNYLGNILMAVRAELLVYYGRDWYNRPLARLNIE